MSVQDKPAVKSEPVKTAEKTTPATLGPVGQDVPAAPGTDLDSILWAAKHKLAAADSRGDDRARDQVASAVKARALVAERNGAGPERVRAIDAELKALGFEVPLATTEAQRGPVGRKAPEKATA